jgi:hypothetical protein
LVPGVSDEKLGVDAVALITPALMTSPEPTLIDASPEPEFPMILPLVIANSGPNAVKSALILPNASHA